MSASEMNTTVTGSCLCGSVRYEVSGEAECFYNCFCQRCGGPMPRVVPALDGVLIPAGSLDSPSPLPAQARIFWDSRAEWSCSDDLPVFSEYPPGA